MKEAAGDYKRFIHKIDRDNNIGLVRYCLAISVFIAHFNALLGGSIPWMLTSLDAVGGFFTLSGFLLMYPLLKGESLVKYIRKRAWRLLPSYFFVVLLFAVLLSFLSNLSIGEYFGNRGFYEYLLSNLSFLNFLHPDLPGVFTELKLSAVNGSLWTMKVEWALTLVIPLIIWSIKKYRLDLRKSMLAVIIVSLVIRFVFYLLSENGGQEIYDIFERQFMGQALFFFSGVFLYTYYEELKRRKTLFIIVSLVVYIIFRCIDFIPFYYQLLYPFVISLLVLSISVIPGKLIEKIDRGHNISYEIYLCHFPILQILAQYEMTEKIGAPVTFALSIIATILVAYITNLTVGRIYLRHRTGS